MKLTNVARKTVPVTVRSPLQIVNSFILNSVMANTVINTVGVNLSAPNTNVFSLFLLRSGNTNNIVTTVN